MTESARKLKYLQTPKGQSYLARRRAKGLETLKGWIATGSVTPSMRRAWRLRRKAELRARALLLLGSFCKRCGNSDERVLQIDHLSPVGKRHKDRVMGETFYRSIVAEPYKFQRLCANCNIIKAIENGERGSKRRIVIGTEHVEQMTVSA